LLPAIITTPAHGTAFDIAGKGVADPGAMREAFRIACEMAMSRSRSRSGPAASPFGRVYEWLTIRRLVGK
jgi:isocitrate/isopropylmalate dehydrogenase